jgi:hypothetical protein
MLLIYLLGYMISIKTLVLGDTNSAQLKLVNDAGTPIELYWVKSNEAEKTLIKQTTKPLRNGTDTWVTFSSHFDLFIQIISYK